MLAVCPRNIYVLCCDIVDVLQVVFVDKIVDFELAMFANEGIIQVIHQKIKSKENTNILALSANRCEMMLRLQCL